MSIQLLTTKLYTPLTRPDLVSRPRLIERLNAGIRRKLTLVSAPAGFGKTTLICEWINGVGSMEYGVKVSPTPYSLLPTPYFAWLSLDRGDNDPARFWAYVVAALQTVPTLKAANVGQDALAMFKSPQPVPHEAILTTLINEITVLTQDSDPDSPLVLVLDDFHLIETPPIHRAIAFLLDHLPPQMHVVVLTRVTPSFSLARLRARGQMTEIGMDDLRFTSEEAAAFLNQTPGPTLAPADVRALETRTEGWVTGLQMAAISMRGQADAAAFIQAFTGSNRYILDYLMEEVLNQEPEEVQTFLLHTSILDRLSGPLCDAVCAETSALSQETLERLEEANLFVVPLDQDRSWYRYHRLFAELLRGQLRKSHPAILPTLHRRASEWYERNQFPIQAVNHALAANDFERAAQLVERYALDVLDRGEEITLVGWLDALPDALVRARPWLCVFHAWMLLLSGEAEVIESRLQDAERGLAALDPYDGQTRRIQGYVAAIRALVAFIRGQTPGALQFAREALAKVPSTDHSVRVSITLILGAAHATSGDFSAAMQSFEEARSIGRASGNYFSIMMASCGIAQMEAVWGHLRRAANTYQAALRLVEKPAGTMQKQPPIAGYAYGGLASVMYQWNDLESAARYAKEGVALCKLLGQAEILMNSQIALAQVQQARGDSQGALATFEGATQVASELSVWSVFVIAAHRARLWLAQGDVRAASRWAQESGLSADDDLGLYREVPHLTWARVLIAQGDDEALADAARLLERMLEAARAVERTGSVIEILMLQALVRQAQGDVEQALAALERALSLAEPEGYVRLFVDEGEAMLKLLRRAASQGITPQYTHKLLAAFEPGEYIAPHPQPLPEPLTGRELDVLRLIAAGLPNREIAEQFYVSINTIKSHTRNIYGKLNVHNRTQAVNRARELELL
jgi:LuxR family maltose regulon positive regulatory protein